MIKKLEYTKDSVGQNYISIPVYHSEAYTYLEQLKEILDDEFEIYTESQKTRDHGEYHITVINVADYNRLSKQHMEKFISSVENLLRKDITDIQFIGLGTASKNNNRTYFIVVKSNQLAEIRTMYGLPPQDFHVTLGFKWKDVFGVPKNEVLEEFSPFLKLLSKNYYINENFNFIKEIGNFTEDESEEVIPLNISKKYLKISCGDYYMDIGLLDGKFWIMTKYKSNENLPRLSQNEISKILK